VSRRTTWRQVENRARPEAGAPWVTSAARALPMSLSERVVRNGQRSRSAGRAVDLDDLEAANLLTGRRRGRG